MTFIDLGTAFFEFGSAVITTLTIFKIIKDKHVSGVFWKSWFFYVAWTSWEILFVYPALNLELAYYLCWVRLFGQMTWLVLAMYYMKKNK